MNWKDKRVIITGGLGFIGSHLTEQLLSRRADVTIVDTMKVRPYLFDFKMREYLAICKRTGTTPKYNEIDLQFESQTFRSLIQKTDAQYVFHLAAHFGGRGFLEQQQSECAAIFAVDQNVFRVSQEEGVEKLFYSSTASVYPKDLQNNTAYLLKESDAAPIWDWKSADNLHGWAKLLAERQLHFLYKEKGFKSAIGRFLTIYGPREYDDSHAIVALINRSLQRDNPFVVWGDGNQERGFTYVGDLVEAIIRATEVVEDAEPLNFGVDWRVKIKEVVAIIHELLGFAPKIHFDTTAPVGPYSCALDISRSRELLGWSPRVDIREGLEKTVSWYKENFPKLQLACQT
jgi:nucleoside-diphosphate-sugar epimerase